MPQTTRTPEKPTLTDQELCQLWETAEMLGPVRSESMVVIANMIPSSWDGFQTLGGIHERYVAACKLSKSTFDLFNLYKGLCDLPGEPLEFADQPNGTDTSMIKVRRSMEGDRSNLMGTRLLEILTRREDHIPIRDINPTASASGRDNLSIAYPARNRWLAYRYAAATRVDIAWTGVRDCDPEGLASKRSATTAFEHLSDHGLLAPPYRGSRAAILWKTTPQGDVVLAEITDEIEEVRARVSDELVDPDEPKEILGIIKERASFATLHQRASETSGHFEAGDASRLREMFMRALREYNGRRLTLDQLVGICGQGHNIPLTSVKLDRMFRKQGDDCVLKPVNGEIVGVPTTERVWQVRLPSAL